MAPPAHQDRRRRPLGRQPVRQHGTSYDEAYAFAVELAQRHGYRFLSAFDDADVIAGQGNRRHRAGRARAGRGDRADLVAAGWLPALQTGAEIEGVRVVGAQVEGV